MSGTSTGIVGDFFTEWADARRDAATGDFTNALARVHTLERLACNARERVLIATVQILAGATGDDRTLLQSGLHRLQGATNDELLEAIDGLSDLSILGTVVQRRHLLEPLVIAALPDDDAAAGFIADPGIADARTITSGGWRPDPQLSPALRAELRSWLAWASIDAWLAFRRPEYLDVLHHEAVRVRGGGVGSWEYQAALAVAELSKGSLDGARAKLARLRRGASLPVWAGDRLCRIISTYAPLACRNVDLWMGECPGAPLSGEKATTPIERAGVAFSHVVTKPSHGDFIKVADDIRSAPWITFCYFASLQPGVVLAEVAGLLASSIKRPEDVARWPWPGRVKLFVDACDRLEDARLALSLLSHATEVIRDPLLSAACVGVLARVGPAELTAISGSTFADALGVAIGELPAPRQRMLKRGGVWRAVIDGTNVAFGGKSKKAGAVARLAYLTQSLALLAEEGYEEIVIYLDRATRHYVTAPEWNEIELMQANDRVSIVAVADSYVIEAFLEAPQVSVIVTCDTYREWHSEYPSLSDFWPKSRVEFHIDHHGKLALSQARR